MFDQLKNILSGNQKNQLMAMQVKEWETSPIRKEMLKGEMYYGCRGDIQDREQKDTSTVNNKVDYAAEFKKQVDEKTNYFLSKPFTLEAENEPYIALLEDVLGKYRHRTMKRLSVEMSVKGVAYLIPYISEKGALSFYMPPSEEIYPLYSDNMREELSAFYRIYDVVHYEGTTKKNVTKVEYYTGESVEYYIYESGVLKADYDRVEDQYFHYMLNDKGMYWGMVPLIVFKNNHAEMNDLRMVKTFIDALAIVSSDAVNSLEELRETIYELKGYYVEDKASFVKDLVKHKLITLDEDGSLNTVNTQLEISGSLSKEEALKKDIVKYGMSVDYDKAGTNNSAIALKFLYQSVALKCAAQMEELQVGFDRLREFIHIHLADANSMKAEYEEDVRLVFNEDIMINEADAIEMIVKSEGIVSEETLLAQHPWVTNVQEEIERLSVERAEKQAQANVYNNTNYGFDG